MRHLLNPKYIVAPPEPEEGTPEHLEWLKEVKPTRLIEWKDFEDEMPSFPSTIYWTHPKYRALQKLRVVEKLDPPFWKHHRWCYADKYEPAKAQENRWNPLGDGWVLVSKDAALTQWKRGGFLLTLCNGYWEIEKEGSAQILAAIHESIAYEDTIKQIIADVKESR